MRPFVKREGSEWRQEGEEVEVLEEKLRYHKQNLAVLIEDTHNQLNADFFRKLSFTLEMKPHESVQIAYCVPYTYSQLLEDLKQLK